ncbi:MAG: hypothetical protein STSR0007_01390 [Thermovirga sp.]
MMEFREPQRGKFFCSDINITERVRTNHLLRRVAEVIDFDFPYREVADRYGTNDNVSVPRRSY